MKRLIAYMFSSSYFISYFQRTQLKENEDLKLLHTLTQSVLLDSRMLLQ